MVQRHNDSSIRTRYGEDQERWVGGEAQANADIDIHAPIGGRRHS